MFRNAYDPRNDTVAQLSPDLPAGSFVHLLNGSLFASGAQQFSGTSLTLGSGSQISSLGFQIPSNASYYTLGTTSDWFAGAFQNITPVTFVAIVKPNPASVGTDIALGFIGNTYTSSEKGFAFFYENRSAAGSPNKFRVFICKGQSGVPIADGTLDPAVVAGQKYCIVIRNSPSAVYGFVNGVATKITNNNNSPAGGVTRAVQVGRVNYTSTINPFFGIIEAIAFVPQRMNDNWCLRTSLDPYPSLLRGRMARRWVPSAGGAATHTSTGALSADAATIAGTAGHVALHPSTGALTADSAITAGTAAHQQPHPSTGALSADQATIAGTAGHVGIHPSTGALTADPATTAGTATHTGVHPATGALSADNAVIDGAASSAAANTHPSTGALSADPAAVAGTATHVGVHPSTGALSADSAVIDGTANHTQPATHPATGALSADAAVIAGAAVHSGPHPTTGDLTADSAVIAGFAQVTHPRTTIRGGVPQQMLRAEQDLMSMIAMLMASDVLEEMS